ncbi:MAG: hypothetical protein Q9170_001468 [Blastenia crenularia]
MLSSAPSTFLEPLSAANFDSQGPTSSHTPSSHPPAPAVVINQNPLDINRSSGSTLSDVPSDPSDSPPNANAHNVKGGTLTAINDTISRLSSWVMLDAAEMPSTSAPTLRRQHVPRTPMIDPSTQTVVGGQHPRVLEPVTRESHEPAGPTWNRRIDPPGLAGKLRALLALCRPMVAALARSLCRFMGSWLMSWSACLCVTGIVVVGISLAATVLMLCSAIALLDTSAGWLCQAPGISSLFLLGCHASTSSFLTIYVFHGTCSKFAVGDPLGIGEQPFWDTGVDTIRTDYILHDLDQHLNKCRSVEARIHRVRTAFAVSEEEQEILLRSQINICRIIGGISGGLPRFYRHAATFSDGLMQHIDTTQGKIETVIKDESRDAVIEQYNLSHLVPGMLRKWQRRYIDLAVHGENAKGEVVKAVDLAGSLHDGLQNAKLQTARARLDKIKRFPLLRRIGRALRLFRVPPEELFGLDEALDGLEELLAGDLARIALLTFIRDNFTHLGASLSELARQQFTADVRFEIGPGGMLDLLEHYTNLKKGTRGVIKSIDGAKVVKRNANTGTVQSDAAEEGSGKEI